MDPENSKHKESSLFLSLNEKKKTESVDLLSGSLEWYDKIYVIG